MNNNQYIGDDDLVYNTASRVPVCLCLDVSGSMSNCIGELQEGVKQFYDAVRKSDTARLSCEISIVTFDSYVNILEDFSLVDKKKNPRFTASGSTNMTDGILKALELLDERKKDYNRNGIHYHQPWLVIMSDGAPNDPQSVERVQAVIRDMENNKKLVVFAIGIGNYADMEVLNNFSKRGAKALKGFNFEGFFEWLGKSVSIVSQSKVGEKVNLDMTDLDTWAEI